MSKQVLHVSVRDVDHALIADVERLISAPPPGDLVEAQKRIHTLAHALFLVANQCTEMMKALVQLNNVEFEKR